MASSVSAGTRGTVPSGSANGRGGSGMVVDSVNTNISWQCADSVDESPSGSHHVWAINLTTGNRIAQYTLASGISDFEGLSMLTDTTGSHFLVCWQNTPDRVDFYPRPSISDSQSLVSGSLTRIRAYTPANGVNSGNIESFWYDKWEDRLNWIRQRGDSSSYPNDNTARVWWRTGAGWASSNISTGAGIPSTTVSSVGSVIARPSGGNMPNAAGDACTIHPDILVLFGVANATGVPVNKQVMYWIKASSDSWAARLASGPHYPDGVLGELSSSVGSEHGGWDDTNKILYAGPESTGSSTNFWPISIVEDGGDPPASPNTGKRVLALLMGG